MKYRMMVLLLTLQATSLIADDNLNSLIGQSKKSYDKGNFGASYESLLEAGSYVFEKMPLKLADFTLVEKPAEGYGIYTRRESNKYRADDPIYAYCEPMGYVFKQNNNEYNFGLAVDFSVCDSEGNVLGGQNDFGRFEMVSYQKNKEFLLNLTYSLSGLEPGDYKIHTSARDLNSSKQTTETIEIRIIK